MTDINALKQANAKRWANAKLTRKLGLAARSLIASKPRYQAVEDKTDVPWWIIAVSTSQKDEVRSRPGKTAR